MSTTTARPKIASAVYEIAASLIQPDPNQPRKAFDPDYIASLGESIKAEGLQQPITVRQNPEKPGNYIIVMGECRWRAHCHAGIQVVRCHLASDRIDTAKRFRNQVIENKGRRDMSLKEDAFAAKQMQDNGDADEIAARAMYMSVYRLRNVRRMTMLSDEVWLLLEGGSLNSQVTEFVMSKIPDQHVEPLLRRCAGKTKKRAAAIVDAFIDEMNQSNFDLACQNAGVTAKAEDLRKQIALHVMAVASAIENLSPSNQKKLARTMAKDVTAMLSPTQKNRRGALFLATLMNAVDAVMPEK